MLLGLRTILERPIGGMRIRIHGDYHAGQVLWTGSDFVIIDFEGEPGRPLGERRLKRSPLRDVAGMLRSFHYAAYGTLLTDGLASATRPEDVPRLQPWARLWYETVGATFLRAYLEGMAGTNLLPDDEQQLVTLLDASLLQKALYEVVYELNNRPSWTSIPLRGILELAGPLAAEPAAIG
jgi:maltose alpha-D-glucosyltransferase/alpha-amylase